LHVTGAPFLQPFRMASPGVFGSTWQQAPGARDNLRSNLTLLEAFGAEPGTGAPGIRATGADEVATDDEVPRIFSMKAQPGFGGPLLGSFRPSNAQDFGWTGSATGFRSSGIDGWGQQHLLHPGRTVQGEGFASSALLSGGGVGLGSGSGDPCWVTVFGFQGQMAAAVRQQLQSLCGPILEVCHGEGNFMHVRFQGPQAASACLALNGQILIGQLMVGCVPCAHSALLASTGSDLTEEDRCRAAAVPGGSLLPGGPGAPQARRGGLLWRLLDNLFDI